MVQIKVNKTIIEEKNIILEDAIKGFLNTKAEIDALNEKMKEYKEVISQKAKEHLKKSDAATCTLGVDDGAVKVTFGWDITVADEPKLRVLLGDRFKDLVNESVTYKPVAKLKELALDDDGLKECLSIKEKAPALSVVK